MVPSSACDFAHSHLWWPGNGSSHIRLQFQDDEIQSWFMNQRPKPEHWPEAHNKRLVIFGPKSRVVLQKDNLSRYLKEGTIAKQKLSRRNSEQTTQSHYLESGAAKIQALDQANPLSSSYVPPSPWNWPRNLNNCGVRYLIIIITSNKREAIYNQNQNCVQKWKKKIAWRSDREIWGGSTKGLSPPA